MAYTKGAPKPEGSGRKPGQTNHDTAKLRGMIAEALHVAGGVDYLVRQAEAEPVAFMSLVGKVIPKEIEATVNMSITLENMLLEIDQIDGTGERESD